MLRYNICCNVTEIFHINRKIKVLNTKLEVFVTIIIIFSFFNLLQFTIQKFFTLKVAKFKDVLDV